MKISGRNSGWAAVVPAAVLLCSVVAADPSVRTIEFSRDGVVELRLGNDRVRLTVQVADGAIRSDRLVALPGQTRATQAPDASRLETDGGFAVDLMFTGWRAPGKLHNADNPVLLTETSFQVRDHRFLDTESGGRAIELDLAGEGHSLEARLRYSLEPDAFYIRRTLAVRDAESHGHFLRSLRPFDVALIDSAMSPVKVGGFGQPIALASESAGAFFGLEYPTGRNDLVEGQAGPRVEISQQAGVRIGEEWVRSEPAVWGVSPDARVKRWFETYLDAIRVAPLRPYLLYNSWYDVRSPEYTDRDEDVMNERNLRRIIDDFRDVKRRHPGFRLDTFVLDDGWDVYESDWVLREEEFPGGLQPVSDALAEMDTGLGIWIGPTGGYSFRQKRIDWMKANGYEVVGDQLCIAGARYRELLERRVAEFIRDHGAVYFKWDGIQFSCSEPDHGHPVGLDSRRAVMESVIGLAALARAESPEMFLNITSGTWLSPWWVQVADTIWMQGRDYGYSDVPSITKRDRAMTYRDVVLYENYGVNDLWFPIANLMTHGIIKGHLQKLGGEAEPLDRFTDNAVLYFARGVAMWELYVSPNLLSEAEWDAIAQSVLWAEDRFDTLKTTEMIGGDPGNREPYGYAHFSGKRGIVAARNPFVAPGTLRVELAPEHGLSPRAASLVLERVYPTRWISPELYAAGATVELPLDAYETAIYELYPVGEAEEPLLAGVVFESEPDGERHALRLLESTGQARLLNPERLTSIEAGALELSALEIGRVAEELEPPKVVREVRRSTDGDSTSWTFEVNPRATEATFAVLLRPEGEGQGELELSIRLDGGVVEPRVESQEDNWSWRLVDVAAGVHEVRVDVQSAGTASDSADSAWRGSAEAWLLYGYRPDPVGVTLTMSPPRYAAATARPLPPRPRAAGELSGTTRLGEIELPD